VYGGDFRGEGRAAGSNGETSTEAEMLEVQLKMLAAVNKTNDQLEKVEVAIRRQRVLPPAPPPPVWNRSNRPYINLIFVLKQLRLKSSSMLIAPILMGRNYLSDSKV
jgi:hypothetical protein